MRESSRNPEESGDGSSHGPRASDDLPVVPPTPDLPQTPEITANLPKLEKREPEEKAEEYRRLGIAYSVPMALVVPILGLIILGAWLDRVTKSSYFTLIGAVVGIIVGFMNMIRLVSRLNR